MEDTQISIEKEHSINAHSAQPTIGNDFVLQSGHAIIPTLSVSANANLKSGAIAQNSLDFFDDLIDDYIKKYAFSGTGVITSKNYSTGINNITINKSLIYPI